VPLREHFKGWRAMEITYRSAELYTEARLKAKKANATINRELELLRRALRLAKDRGLLLSLPKISLLPEHNTRQGFFERPELEALVTALPDYLKDMTRFGYITGMRLGEIKSLRWEDVDREVGALRTPA
jgi:integrase